MKIALTFIWGFIYILTFGQGTTWNEQILAENEYEHSRNIFSKDIDNDGDIDILTSGGWIENVNNINYIYHSYNLGVLIAVIDVNGDGNYDLMTQNSDSTLWHENDGFANFNLTHFTGVNVNSYINNKLVVLNIDNDGDFDIAVQKSNSIHTYFNNGNGTFSFSQSISTTLIQNIHSADIDNDGDEDLLYANANVVLVSWIENLGGGLFGQEEQLDYTGQLSKSCVNSGDMDGDGDIDVVIRSTGGRFVWIPNLGNGNFGPTQVNSSGGTTSCGGCGYSIGSTIDDLDNDGDLDIITGISRNYTGFGYRQSLDWHENDGNGNFTPHLISNFQPGKISCILSEDIDGDGNKDILHNNSVTKSINSYNNDGNGNFNNPTPITPVPSLLEPTSIYAVDLNSDNLPDIISASRENNRIVWYENTGSSNFGTQNIISQNANQAQSAYAADLDNDGDNDVLSASYGDNKIAWYENDGLGIFSSENIISVNSSGAYCVFASDLNGDNTVDVLSASNLGDKLEWYPNDGSGNFGLARVISITTIDVTFVSTADIDNDGDQDVLSASNNKISWFENDGLGNFGPENVIDQGSFSINSMSALDMDGDGDIDISLGDPNLKWFKNDGAGNYTIAYNSNGNTSSPSISVSDFNNDGLNDIVLGSHWDGNTQLYLNEGGGILGTNQNINIVQPFCCGQSIFSIDIDGDYDQDIVSCGHNNRIVLYENLADFPYHYTINQGDCSLQGSIIISSENHIIPFHYSLYRDSVLIITDSSTAWIDTLNGLNLGEYTLFLSDSAILDTFSFLINGPDLNPDYDLAIKLNGNPIYSEIQTSLSIQYRNQDCTPTDGEYWLVIDSNITIDSFLIQPDSYSGDTVKWFFSGINIDSGWIYNYVYFKTIYSPIAIEEICFSSGINPVNQDINTLNNSAEFCDSVIPGINITLDNYSCTSYANLNFEFLSNNFPHTYSWINVDSTINGSNTSSTINHTINNLEHGIWYFNISDSVGNSVDRTYYIQPPDSFSFVDFTGHAIAGNFIPGINDNLDIYFYNLGCQPSNGYLLLVLDPNITINSAPGANYISSDTIIFPTGNITAESPLNFHTIIFSPNNGLGINDQICFSVYFFPDSLDSNQENNEKHYCWPVLAPYDPNDKTVYPHGACYENFVEKDVPLEYLIRYQNTGTAPAINVTILDTIDAELLPNSLRLLSASYEHTFVEQINDSVVAFRMYNINLLDSGTNVHASQGYVYYTIDIDSLTNDYVTIENSAAIYFDYNEPIITNTTLNTVISDLASVHTISYDTLNYCDSALFNGNWYYNSQIFSDTLDKANGCDSIIHTTLFINYSVLEIQTQIACDSIEVFGNWYYNSQTLLDTFSTFYGCDSIVETNITLYNVTTQNNMVSSCDFAQVNGTSYFTSQVVRDTFQTSFGCDSIINTNLTINYSSFATQTIIACDSIEFFGNWYYTSQSVYDTFTTANNCDSVIQTDITIYNSKVQNESKTQCDSAEVNNNWYFASQLIKDTFQTIKGCDSIINTDLTIHNSIFETQVDIACDSVEVFGNWYYSSQTVYNTFTTANNCDSVIQTDITIYNSVIQNETKTECDSVKINENWYFASQLVRDTFQTITGCDSIISFMVTINNSNQIYVFDTIQMDEIYTLPSGLIVNQTGIYFDTLINIENCDSIIITNLYVKDNVGIIDNKLSDFNWSIYPNPTSNSFTLEVVYDNKEYSILIFNTLGQTIYSNEMNNRKKVISTIDWADGIYNITIKDKTGILMGNKKISIRK